MSKPEKFDDCYFLSEVINLILENEENEKKKELTRKLSELIAFPEHMRFWKKIKRDFEKAFNEPSLLDLSKKEIHERARDLALILVQTQMLLAIEDATRRAVY